MGRRAGPLCRGIRMAHPPYSRREFGKLALTGLPAVLAVTGGRARAFEKINSKIKGVQFGAITYSFNRIASNPDDIIKAFVSIGLGEMEIMSGHAETLAGAPAGRAERAPWRKTATEAMFAPVRKKIEDAGIAIGLLCYNMNVASTTDDDIEYGFMMARALGAKALSTSTQVSMAKRLAPFAEKHKMMVGFHGHDSIERADEVHNEASFLAVMAAGEYLGANLDIGHYTAAGGDAVAFVKAHHARITNLHVKDMTRSPKGYTPFGQGNAPIKEVLQLLSREKWNIPANIEFEYPGDPLVEVPKCFQYCKEALN